MSKTPEYQKKSSAKYDAGKRAAGYVRFSKWIRKNTKVKLEELIKEMEAENSRSQ